MSGIGPMIREPAAPMVGGMNSSHLVNWVRQHPVLAFLAWFFPVGWAIAFIPFIAQSTLGIELSMEPFIIASTWLGLLLPVVVIVRMIDGPAGLERMRQQIVRVRVNLDRKSVV